MFSINLISLENLMMTYPLIEILSIMASNLSFNLSLIVEFGLGVPGSGMPV